MSRSRRLAPVALAEIDLRRVPESLERLGDAVAVEALVRRDGEPVGWVRLPVTDGRCSSAMIRAVLDRLTFPPPRTAAPAPGLSVTVAICTRDRTEDLALCLDSLDGWTTRISRSWWWTTRRPATRPVCWSSAEAAACATSASRDLGSTGPATARSRRPRGKILAFTDDDVMVDPGWLHALAAAFGDRSTAVAAVTGLVLPAELQTEAQVLFERYRSFARGFTPRRVAPEGTGPLAVATAPPADYGTGANMAFRRSLFTRIGAFDPALGAGTPTRGGDDLDMFFRVLKEGHVLVYEPRAIVRHRHRRSMEGLRSQIADHGVSFSAYIVRNALSIPRRAAGVRPAGRLVVGQDRLPHAVAQGEPRRRAAPARPGRAARVHRRTHPLPRAKRVATRLAALPLRSETRT